MRRSYEGKIFSTDSGSPFAISLGADFCAEHEWGIKPLRKYFGLDDTKMGIEKRRINTIPKALFFSEKQKISSGHNEWTEAAVMHFASPPFEAKYCSEFFPGRSRFGEDKEHNEAFGTAWDEDSFAITIKCPNRSIGFLETLYKAMKEKDVAILMSGGGIFSNSGLSFAIISLVPDVAKEVLRKADEDAAAANKGMKDSGIEKFLKDKGKSYHCLSPQLKDGKLIFWLNPEGQHLYSLGWYTVEELRLWAEEKGPVILKKKGSK
jgi:hypothetical protein